MQASAELCVKAGLAVTGANSVTVRVLLAEDEAMIALTLSDILEAEGYEVTIAGDGAKALARARQFGEALDVLVTDLNMPEMSGEDLIHALRGDRPELPVVVVTGSAPVRRRGRAATQGRRPRAVCAAAQADRLRGPRGHPAARRLAERCRTNDLCASQAIRLVQRRRRKVQATLTPLSMKVNRPDAACIF